MRAVVYTEYGSADVLRIEDVGKPVPKDDEVLVAVRAAALNPFDRHSMRGDPPLVRLMFGLRRPKVPRLGVDFAGIVEAVGKNVKDLRSGDEVFGAGRGTFADFACAHQDGVARKSGALTFEQAASINIAGLTALQGLRDRGRVQPGQTVLVNGAAGGVGTFAVQLAKHLGAEVTGVCSTRNVELVRSLGAVRVIDYTKEDFTKSGVQYDVLLDCAGSHSVRESGRAVKPKGRHVLVGGSTYHWSDPLPTMFGALLSPKAVMLLAKRSKQDLTLIRELIEAGNVTPVIDRRYPLTAIADAMRHLETGHARGKIVINLE